MPRNWDEHYSDPSKLDFTPTPLLVEVAELLPPGRALDLACGAGRNSLYLASLGWQVTAVDSSPVAIRLLRDRARGLDVDARVADLETGDFRIEPAAYDLICDFFYLQRDLFPQHPRRRAARRHFRGSHPSCSTVRPTRRPEIPAFLLRPGGTARRVCRLEDPLLLRSSRAGTQPSRRPHHRAAGLNTYPNAAATDAPSSTNSTVGAAAANSAPPNESRFPAAAFKPIATSMMPQIAKTSRAIAMVRRNFELVVGSIKAPRLKASGFCQVEIVRILQEHHHDRQQPLDHLHQAGPGDDRQRPA